MGSEDAPQVDVFAFEPPAGPRMFVYARIQSEQARFGGMGIAVMPPMAAAARSAIRLRAVSVSVAPSMPLRSSVRQSWSVVVLRASSVCK